jgi:hypothetical protein
VQLSTEMVAEFQGAVANFVQLGEMLVSDHAKLVAAAQDFGTNPAYSVKDANTLTQSVNTFQAASRQKIIKDLLPIPTRPSTIRAGTTTTRR